MRWCFIKDIAVSQTSYSQPIITVGRGYAGESPGARDSVDVRLDLTMSYESLEQLQAYFSQLAGASLSPVAAMQQMGATTNMDDLNARRVEEVERRERRQAGKQVSQMEKQLKYLGGQLKTARRALRNVADTLCCIVPKGVEVEGRQEDILRALFDLKAAALPPYKPKMKPQVPECRRCGAGTIVRAQRRTGKEFTGCTNWPGCTWIYRATEQKPDGKKPAYASRRLDFE